MAFFKRAPMKPMMRVDTHKEIVAGIEGELRDAQELLANTRRAMVILATELNTLRAEQERRKAQARANLKQFRTA